MSSCANNPNGGVAVEEVLVYPMLDFYCQRDSNPFEVEAGLRLFPFDENIRAKIVSKINQCNPPIPDVVNRLSRYYFVKSRATTYSDLDNICLLSSCARLLPGMRNLGLFMTILGVEEGNLIKLVTCDENQIQGIFYTHSLPAPAVKEWARTMCNPRDRTVCSRAELDCFSVYLSRMKSELELDLQNNRLVNAFGLFTTSFYLDDESMRFVRLIMALESLLKTTKKDIKKSLAKRVGILLGNQEGTSTVWADVITRLYEIRSKIVHGESVSNLDEDVLELENLVRTVFCKILDRRLENIFRSSESINDFFEGEMWNRR